MKQLHETTMLSTRINIFLWSTQYVAIYLYFTNIAFSEIHNPFIFWGLEQLCNKNRWNRKMPSHQILSHSALSIYRGHLSLQISRKDIARECKAWPTFCHCHCCSVYYRVIDNRDISSVYSMLQHTIYGVWIHQRRGAHTNTIPNELQNDWKDWAGVII